MAEPDCLAVEEALLEALEEAPDEDAAMLEVMVEPAELVVVTTEPEALSVPDVVLVVMVEPAELVVVTATTVPLPLELELSVEVYVLPAESVPVVMTTVVPLVVVLVEGVLLLGVAVMVEVYVLPAELVPVVTTNVVAPPVCETVEVKGLPSAPVPVVTTRVESPPWAVDVAVETDVVVDPDLALLEPAEEELVLEEAPEAEMAAGHTVRTGRTRLRLSSGVDGLTLTELGAESDGLLHIIRATDGRAAVANAEAEVGVVAQTLDVVWLAAERGSLAQHVGDASLL